jgi:hypothetical protein
MNKLYVGFSKSIELPKGGSLFIDDEARKAPEWRRPRIFDPLKHSFNPLKGIDYKKVREIADALCTISPQGENAHGKKWEARACPRASCGEAARQDQGRRGSRGVSAICCSRLS